MKIYVFIFNTHNAQRIYITESAPRNVVYIVIKADRSISLLCGRSTKGHLQFDLKIPLHKVFVLLQWYLIKFSIYLMHYRKNRWHSFYNYTDSYLMFSPIQHHPYTIIVFSVLDNWKLKH